MDFNEDEQVRSFPYTSGVISGQGVAISVPGRSPGMDGSLPAQCQLCLLTCSLSRSPRIIHGQLWLLSAPQYACTHVVSSTCAMHPTGNDATTQSANSPKANIFGGFQLLTSPSFRRLTHPTPTKGLGKGKGIGIGG